MKNIFIATAVILLSLSIWRFYIGNRTTTKFPLGRTSERYSSINEYLSRGLSVVKSGTTWSDFEFINNPYGLTERDIVSLRVNDHLVYKGKYKKSFSLKGDTDAIFLKSKILIVTMELAITKSSRAIYVYRFQGKKVFTWDEKYKIIYGCFCPTNESVEQIYFIPHIEHVM